IEENDESVIPVCPEQLGGLPTPRNPSAVPEGGEKVLDGKGEVFMRGWGDVTSKFLKGAEETLKLTEIFDIEKAIMKSESPSCGSKKIPKNFREKIEGYGVTVALLKRNGIEILSEEDIKSSD
ncbi:hypothetical protein AKJ53_01870, partial [candidate division MSBL1 archaeon SCGC-AAA382F02]